MQFIVLSSSHGTTFQAVIDALEKGTLKAHCLGLVTDRDDRGCAQKARSSGLPVIIVERQKDTSRDAYDQRLDAAIRSLIANENELTVIAALGWMFILSPWFVRRWKNRIVNVHPALLPRHPGAHALRETLIEGDTESGMTIHCIDEGIDTGQILVQKKCPVFQSDTEDSLKSRIQELEKEWFSIVLEQIQSGSIKLP